MLFCDIPKLFKHALLTHVAWNTLPFLLVPRCNLPYSYIHQRYASTHLLMKRQPTTCPRMCLFWKVFFLTRVNDAGSLLFPLMSLTYLTTLKNKATEFMWTDKWPLTARGRLLKCKWFEFQVWIVWLRSNNRLYTHNKH